MFLDLLLFGLGLAGLYFGAEWLVDGAARVATNLGVSSLIVGLTLVSIGTSAPELIVSGLASYRGNGGLAVGNVLGSNVANIGLILGMSALIIPMATGPQLIGRDIPAMVAAAVLIPILGFGGTISRIEGALLLALCAAYVVTVARAARKESVAARLRLEPDVGGHPHGRRPVAGDLTIALVGLVVLATGANLLVESAIDLAARFGVPDVVIGLTMVALGTSLPELAASISAARRGDGQIIIGNVVGSNIFNVLLILGASAVISPLPLEPEVLRGEVSILLAVSFLLLAIAMIRKVVGRVTGAGLLVGYVAFIAWAAV